MPSRQIKVVIKMEGAQKASQHLVDLAAKQKMVNEQTKFASQELRKEERARRSVEKAAKRQNFILRRLQASYIAGNLAARAISATVSRLSGAFWFGVGAAVDFEFSMAKISAISGVVGRDLKSLEGVIKDIASQSPKTSTQVAQAALEMSKMGLAGKDLENSLEGVVGLSVALDESVDAVGRTLLSVKNVFQKDASEITNIADMMFTTLGNSALNLEKFATAFSFAGASARMAGVSFEEMSGAMGVLADSGIKASTIGTQLRQVFTRLDNPVSKISKVIGKNAIKTLGLSGTMKVLKTIIKDSGDAFNYFGLRAVPVIDILANNIDKMDDLTKKTKEMQKSVSDASDLLSGTKKGGIAKIASAFELLFINIGKGTAFNKILGAMSDRVRELANSLDNVEQKSEFVDKFMRSKVKTDAGTFFQKNWWLGKGPWSDEEIKRYQMEADAAWEKKKKIETDLAAKNKEFVENLDMPSVLGGTSLDEGSFSVAPNTDAWTKMVDLYRQATLERITLQAKINKEQEDAAKSIEEINGSLSSQIKIINRKLSLNKALNDLGKHDEFSNLRIKAKLEDLLILAEKNGLTEKQIQLLQILAKIENERQRRIDDREKARIATARKDQEEFEKLAAIQEKAFLKELELQKELNKERERTASFKSELKATLEDEIASATLQAQFVENTMSAIDSLSSGLAEMTWQIVSFQASWESLGQIAGNVLKQIIVDLTATIIKALVLKAVLGIASAGAGGVMSEPVSGGFLSSTNFAAKGFNETVSQPTLFMAGEEGPENVMVTPRAKQSAGNSQSIVLNMNVAGDINGEEQFLNRLRHGMEEIDRRSV